MSTLPGLHPDFRYFSRRSTRPLVSTPTESLPKAGYTKSFASDTAKAAEDLPNAKNVQGDIYQRFPKVLSLFFPDNEVAHISVRLMRAFSSLL